MHALNRKQRRTLLSYTRRRKWAQLAQVIGLEGSIKAMRHVEKLSNVERKKIGRSV